MTKNNIFLIIILIAGGIFSLSQPADAALYEEISALELIQRIRDKSDNGYIILDIRGKNQYTNGHIQGAINIPLQELGYRYIELDKTKDIIVYCDIGVQSKIACQILINVDFKDVYNLTGGLQEWPYALETNNGRVDL